MPSVSSTTTSSSPQAAHRSADAQSGRMMAQASGSVWRRLAPGKSAGAAEEAERGALSTSRDRRLDHWRFRRAAILRETTMVRGPARQGFTDDVGIRRLLE